ncbi:SulP family sulfate permease [Marinilabilia salmonicolor]|jgi:SulP family sulfate permease|uniref:SulP family inorganic anion transporter n=1 Tax=Marinilabilia salmonicolor TaxID=989 RepID=UPI000D04FF78|nr:SulP family inorganic anion transporter [Marinilabilia salmonicolor]PRY99961.1 SulP family sulfate permease [Marinilabilia salmonicolor]
MKYIFKPKLISLWQHKLIDKNTITKDVLAGLVVGIVALPLAIAFAVASGVSPEKGLITAVIAGFIISLLGGSRVQIGGPTGAFVIIVYAIVEAHGLEGLMISTIMAGIFLIAFGLLKLGTLLKFIPHPLVVGFTSGIALVIFSIQVKDAMGIVSSGVPSAFIDKWLFYFRHIPAVNLNALWITLVTILITVGFKKITTRIPGSFIAIIAVSAVVAIANIEVATIGSVFGEIPAKFHFDMPAVSWEKIHIYLGPALTIALLGGIESLLSAVVSDGMIGSNHRSNTELISQGIANVVTPFFGGIPATGAIARTATNVKNGGRTPIAGMVHSVTLLLIMLFFGKYAALIPLSCLAGILMVVAYNMSEWKSFVSILKGSVFDIIVLLTTFFLTVLVDLTVAIEVGIVLASLLFMKRMADVAKYSDNEIDVDVIENYSHIPREVGIFEISGPFFFGSAKQYGEWLKSSGQKYDVLIIRMRHVPFIDSTGVHNLKEAIRNIQKRNTRVMLSGIKPEVGKVLVKGGVLELIGEKSVFLNFGEALDEARGVQNDKSIDH